MIYLITEILFFVLVAAVLGGIVGWLLRRAKTERALSRFNSEDLRRWSESMIHLAPRVDAVEEEVSEIAPLQSSVALLEKESQDVESLRKAAEKHELEIARLRGSWAEMSAFAREIRPHVWERRILDLEAHLGDRAAEPSSGSLDAKIQPLRAKLDSLTRGHEQATAAIETLRAKLEEHVIAAAEHRSGDDLKLIYGIGPVIEAQLHSLGVYTYEQIANWSAQDIDSMAEHLEAFPARIRRDGWVHSARRLVASSTIGTR